MVAYPLLIPLYMATYTGKEGICTLILEAHTVCITLFDYLVMVNRR
jgi:hypothetical protein